MTEKDLAEFTSLPQAAFEGFTETLNTMPEAKFAMFLRQDGGIIKGSLRSDTFKNIDVSKIAHIFGGGYAAGYYVYIWAAVLDADAFDAFKSSGDIYNQALAAKFRKYCLAESGDDEGMTQYRKFRGQEPSIDPLLKRRGLK